jgi:ABC-type multidrug transport system ATPase subunit
MTEQEPVLQARGLIKEYAHRAVLRGIDLDVGPGQVVGLLGANGAGKTTLLGCLASLVRPTAGQVLWFGHLANQRPAQRRQIGMVTHEHRLYSQLTLKENLVFAARMNGVDRPAERAERGLVDVGLGAFIDRFPSQVSRGMCQRAAVARALIHEPRILLLDEPFSGLDSNGADWLMQSLRQLRDAGRTICFATHDAVSADRLANRIWRLRSGCLEEDSVANAAPAASPQRRKLAA